MNTPSESKSTRFARWAGFFAGPPIAAACFYWLPVQYLGADGELVEFGGPGRITLAILAWMATWWLTEAISVYATALLPLGLFPLLGVAPMSAATAPYADPLVFLFMGGFLLSLSMERWGLGRRVALIILSAVGTRPRNMIAGFMLVTAVFSAFVSNTATTAMMLPIALSVIGLVSGRSKNDSPVADDHTASESPFGTCLLLAIAYAASIGGCATIIGSPPNAFTVGFLRESIAEPYRTEVSFLGWMAFGVPFTVVMLPLAFLLLTGVLHPPGNRTIEGGGKVIADELRAMGPAKFGEWVTLIVFVITALAWMTRPLLAKISWTINGQPWAPLAGLTDPGIAMTAGLLLFVIPVNLKSRQFVLEWKTAVKLPWGILVLFGGGLSLAAAVQANGVAEFLASYARLFGGFPAPVIVLLVVTGMVLLTELTSNTATAATLVPILAALAPGLGVHPYLLVLPAAVAANCAFMLPVATPPNAIIFGSGRVTIGQMSRAGIGVNLIAIVILTAMTLLLIGPVLKGF